MPTANICAIEVAAETERGDDMKMQESEADALACRNMHAGRMQRFDTAVKGPSVVAGRQRIRAERRRRRCLVHGINVLFDATRATHVAPGDYRYFKSGLSKL